jgi:GT2 family glycosyltransferase
MLMQSSEVVDVVVVSWNVRESLADCIRSVLASRGVRPNLLIVDNDSRDGSADMVEQTFPGVTLIRNPANLGFARATNIGIRAGNSRHVLMLNPDTTVSPEGVAGLVRRLDGLPGYCAIAPRLVGEDGMPQHSVYPFPSLVDSLMLGTGLVRLLPQRLRARLLIEGSWRSDIERDVPWAIGAALLLDRLALQQIGLFDERFFVYAEDLEWFDRAKRKGWRVRFVPSIEVFHAGNRSGAQRYGSDRVAAYTENSIAFFRRRHGLIWTALFVGINGLAVLSRYSVARLLYGVFRRPRLAAWVESWRPYARFYLRSIPGSKLGSAAIPEDGVPGEG